MMNFRRHLLLSLAAGALALATGCASTPPPADPAIVKTLAPTGVLRVGVYAGSPTSLVKKASGERVGVALELGTALSRQLGVPVEVKEFTRLADVLVSVKAGTTDFTFTNATEARAKDMDFTSPLVRLELGYLVMGNSPLKNVADVDRTGMRVGVAQGSTSQGVLGSMFKNAKVVPAPSIGQAQTMLRQSELDAFATNKGILNDMADGLPDSRILEGRWGVENLAIAIPQQHAAALPYLRQFADEARRSGLLAGIIKRAGLRGTAQD